MAENIKRIYEIEVKAVDATQAVGSFTKSITDASQASVQMGEAVEAAMDKSATSTSNAAAKIGKAFKDTNSAAGIAGATVNEFGRFISDLPFGIVAVTNNLSQMGSLFAVLVQQASQMNSKLSTSANVLRLLKDQFLGPTGVLFAFQVAVAAVTYFAKQTEKADSATRSITDAVGAAGVAFKIAKDALNSENVSLGEKQQILGKINEQYPELNLKLGENNKLTAEGNAILDQQILRLKEAAKARAILALVEEQEKKIAEASAKSAQETASFWDKLKANVLGGLTGQLGATEGYLIKFGKETQAEAIKSAEETKQKYVDMLEDEGLVDYLFGGKSGKKKGGLKKKIEDLDLEIKKGVDLLISGQFVGFEELRKGVLRSGLRVQDDAKNALRSQTDETVGGMKDYFNRLQEVTRNGNEAVAKLIFEDKMAIIMASQELVNSGVDVAMAQYQREIDIEKEKTIKINNELKDRLRNEQLSASERKSIQNQIAKNDEELRKKQEKIEEKRFKLNKAASIANAVVNTYLAATQALAEPGSVIQKIASMVAIIGAGLAQVAVIAKQKFVPSASGSATGLSSSGGAGGAGGGGIQPPDFNVVGQSNVSQLAAVVQGQLDRPIKTYVVSGDVTTAQALDRNKVSSASI